ncbi:MAG: CBASS cGAMP-activated phospholipase [Opitutaceae bacterium]|nr:CBASS cGAMP-activated phospholipase [Opitutaceae bacterium]
MYRILSFDGGGIRGLVTLALLKRLEAGVPRFVANTQLLAGTSTGGIIALGLAAGKTVDELINLYRDNGKEIFDDSWLDDLRDLGGATGADYDQKNLERLLKAIFGDLRLRDLQQRVVVPAFDLDNEDPNPAKRTWSPKFFHNFPGNDSDGSEFVVDIALHTSAAPTYFPTHAGFIDGGVVANNPSLAALVQTQDMRNRQTAPKFKDVRLISIGTGRNLAFVKGSTLDWGFVAWAKPLISLLMDASMGIADFQCRHILKDNYCRIAPVFAANQVINLDDWRRADELLAFGSAAPLIDCWTSRDVAAWAKKIRW